MNSAALVRWNISSFDKPFRPLFHEADEERRTYDTEYLAAHFSMLSAILIGAFGVSRRLHTLPSPFPLRSLRGPVAVKLCVLVSFRVSESGIFNLKFCS
jgi:hypothetical protein